MLGFELVSVLLHLAHHVLEAVFDDLEVGDVVVRGWGARQAAAA